MKRVSTEQAIIWVDGAYQVDEHFQISATCSGLGLGMGVFETLRVYAGRPFEFQKHYQRLLEGAQVVGIPVLDSDVLIDAIAGVIEKNGYSEGDCRLKISLYATGENQASTVITTTALPKRPENAKVNVSPYRVNEFSALTGVKATSYAMNLLALNHAHALGYDETIMLNTQGELCEGATSNIFIVKNGALHTPPLESGCLAGVARSTVLEIAASMQICCVEGALSEVDLHACEEAFLTNSLREVQPIQSVNDRVLEQAGGELTMKICNAYKERVNGAE